MRNQGVGVSVKGWVISLRALRECKCRFHEKGRGMGQEGGLCWVA